jgi:hypothetical protein
MTNGIERAQEHSGKIALASMAVTFVSALVAEVQNGRIATKIAGGAGLEVVGDVDWVDGKVIDNRYGRKTPSLASLKAGRNTAVVSAVAFAAITLTAIGLKFFPWLFGVEKKQPEDAVKQK